MLVLIIHKARCRARGCQDWRRASSVVSTSSPAHSVLMQWAITHKMPKSAGSATRAALKLSAALESFEVRPRCHKHTCKTAARPARRRSVNQIRPNLSLHIVLPLKLWPWFANFLVKERFQICKQTNRSEEGRTALQWLIKWKTVQISPLKFKLIKLINDSKEFAQPVGTSGSKVFANLKANHPGLTWKVWWANSKSPWLSVREAADSKSLA